MKTQENWASTCVCYLSIALSTLLVVHMAFDQPVALHTPQTPVQQVSTLYTNNAATPLPFDATELQNILQTTWMPQEALTVKIDGEGRVDIQLEMPRDRLMERFALPALTAKLLPERCAVDMSCSVGIRTNPEQLVVEPLGLTVNGVSLSPTLLEPLTKTLAQVLSLQLAED